jgi:lipopolysaccharide biosynthesis glycosyltransferase
MKRLVYQINVPNAVRKIEDKLTAYTYMPKMYEISERNARQYAEKCEADYYKIETLRDWKPGEGKHLDYQKFKVLDFDEYDQILYLDSDLIIKNNAPDLFKICNNMPAASTEHSRIAPELAKELGMPSERYFNAGLIYFTRDTIEKLRPHVVEYLNKQSWSWEGQGMINKLFFDLNIKYLNLPAEDWNPIPRCFGKYADHYAGAKKRNWGTVSY